MSEQNPDHRKIDVKTKSGLALLKAKADFYGHYSQFLKLKELIAYIEELTKDEQ